MLFGGVDQTSGIAMYKTEIRGHWVIFYFGPVLEGTRIFIYNLYYVNFVFFGVKQVFKQVGNLLIINTIMFVDS